MAETHEPVHLDSRMRTRAKAAAMTRVTRSVTLNGFSRPILSTNPGERPAAVNRLVVGSNRRSQLPSGSTFPTSTRSTNRAFRPRGRSRRFQVRTAAALTQPVVGSAGTYRSFAICNFGPAPCGLPNPGRPVGGSEPAPASLGAREAIDLPAACHRPDPRSDRASLVARRRRLCSGNATCAVPVRGYCHW
jgi:hypothetical protein